jgi:hypothetical protein
MDRGECPSFKLQQILTGDADTAKDRQIQICKIDRSSERRQMQSLKKSPVLRTSRAPSQQQKIRPVQSRDDDSKIVEESSQILHIPNCDANTALNEEECPTSVIQHIQSYNPDFDTTEVKARYVKIQDPNIERTEKKSRSLKTHDIPKFEPKAVSFRRVQSFDPNIERTEWKIRSLKAHDIPKLEPKPFAFRLVQCFDPNTEN